MSTEQIVPQGKTKFASWWLIVVGVAATILGIALIPLNPSSGYSDSPISAPVAYMIFILSLSLPGVLNIIAGTMLIKRKPVAWKLAVALLSAECFLSLAATIAVSVSEGLPIAMPFILTLILCVIPLLLLILDRGKTKNDQSYVKGR
jgi:hypothetical protein